MSLICQWVLSLPEGDNPSIILFKIECVCSRRWYIWSLHFASLFLNRVDRLYYIPISPLHVSFVRQIGLVPTLLTAGLFESFRIDARAVPRAVKIPCRPNQIVLLLLILRHVTCGLTIILSWLARADMRFEAFYSRDIGHLAARQSNINTEKWFP